MTIGDKIKQIRKDRGLTQVQLAEIIELSDRTIQYYEGNKRVPSLELLKTISERLNVSILLLLEGEITTVDLLIELKRREALA
ncbi:helix-turn-helix domain-containing protein [Clostridium paraputrificum]|uniref:helix-turn-helix domain-containing protein n=1 Tax=Clostridium paraputrificum TaxID=29363 RepID=UPI003D3271D7